MSIIAVVTYKVVLFLIVLLAAVLRFWQLGIVPFGVTHDELGYIYNAYSIAKTGENVFGEFLPFLTWIHEGGWPFLPVPIYLSAPFFWIFDLSATTGRLPAAILGIFDIVLLFSLVKYIFNKTSLALLSAFFLAISPWHLHFSRSAYDPNFSIFFYLLAIVFFFYEVKVKKVPIVTSFCFLIAIFSYRATTVLFLPLVGVSLWYGVKVVKMKKNQIMVFLFGVSAVLLSLFFVVAQNGTKYLAETLPDEKKMQEEIDGQIREAQGPLFVRRLFLNKPTYIINKWRENYLNAYSPQFLFLYTEPSGIYSIWSRGRIYFLDVVFIILGVAYLYKVYKKGALFLTLLLLIGGLPGMFGGPPYSSRNFFLSVIFPVFSAGGILFVVTHPFLRKWRMITVSLLAISYTYIFGSYLFDYYGRYAFQGAESWAKSLKDVSFLIAQNKKNYDQTVVATASFGDLMQYAFYAKLHPSEVQLAWSQRNDNAQTYTIGNVVFTSSCLEDKRGDLKPFQGKVRVLYIAHDNCQKQVIPKLRIKDYFGNTVWKIYPIIQK